MNSIDILGVRIDDTTYAESVDRAAALIQKGGAHQICTVNPEFIMRARRDETFRGVLERSALNVPDGVGVLWAARRRGAKLRERVAGVDLMSRLCERAGEQGWRIFLLGAQPGVAEQAAGVLVSRVPGLTVAGTWAGSPHRDEEMEIARRIRHAAPQLVFVAYGAPAQDVWLARNLPLLLPDHAEGLGVVGMGVGGSLDFLTGRQRRAPEWAQRTGLEWLHRLVQNPRRWRRQLSLIQFVATVMLESSRRS